MKIDEFFISVKSILSREKFTLITFSLLYLSFLIAFILYIFQSIPLPTYISSTINIMQYPFIVFVFYVLYYIGIKLQRIIVKVPFIKQQFVLSISVDKESLLHYFDFQGLLHPIPNGFEVSSSSEGMQTKKLFKKCKISFDATIYKGGFGIITNARDFENLFMLKINFNEKEKLLEVVPHVRKDGIWDIFAYSDKSDAKIKINPHTILSFKVGVENNQVSIVINTGYKQLFNNSYILPTHFPLLPSEPSEGTCSPRNIVTKIHWPSCWKIGFRAHGNEIAEIRSLSIIEL